MYKKVDIFPDHYRYSIKKAKVVLSLFLVRISSTRNILILVIAFIFVIMNMMASNTYAMEITIGTDTIVTEMDYNNGDVTHSCEEWLGTIDISSVGNTVSVYGSTKVERYLSNGATEGQGVWYWAENGLSIDWDSGPLGWERAKLCPVNITLDYKYELAAENTGCCGHANVWVQDTAGLRDFLSSINEGYISTASYVSTVINTTPEETSRIFMKIYGDVCTRSMPPGHSPGPATSGGKIYVDDIKFDFLSRMFVQQPILVFGGYGCEPSSTVQDMQIINDSCKKFKVTDLILVGDSNFKVLDSNRYLAELQPFEGESVPIQFNCAGSTSFKTATLYVLSNASINSTMPIMISGFNFCLDDDDDLKKNVKSIYAETIASVGADSVIIPITQITRAITFELHFADCELALEILKPNGLVYGTYNSTTSPIKIEIPKPQIGNWTCKVSAIDIPYENYPYAIVVLAPNSAMSPAIDLLLDE